ncbi:MAG: hypothetical protein AAGU78_04395 [Chloroflexota bacterium]|jgi:ABC-type uncharacterized transport system permease subunit|nr:hypothetical protein [Aggregatilineaceae bacterium]
MDALGRPWLTGCGLAILLSLALVTSGVGGAQFYGALRARRGEPPPAGWRAGLGLAVVLLATALVFWLLLVAALLVQRVGRELAAPWVH